MMTEKVRRRRGREGDSAGEVGGDKIIRPWALFATVVMPYLSTYIHIYMYPNVMQMVDLVEKQHDIS